MKFGIYLVLIFVFSVLLSAQDRSSPDNQPHITPRNQPQPGDEDLPNAPKGESSSKDAQINLETNRPTPPVNAGSDDDVQEMYPFDPHKAAKDVEVGNFYLKRKNYRAA